MWKILEKRPFFRADLAGLGKYHTGGYGRIGVYRVKQPGTIISSQTSCHIKRLFTFLHLDNQVTFLIGHLGCYGNHLCIKSRWDVRSDLFPNALVPALLNFDSFHTTNQKIIISLVVQGMRMDFECRFLERKAWRIVFDVSLYLDGVHIFGIHGDAKEPP